MKKIILLSFVSCLVAFGGVTASAQCDPNTQGTIKCSYYNEGYQDGSNDARNNRSNDYRRYRDKYERKYEDFFRDGYNAGYDSVRPTTRWTNSQRSAYDSGYSIGQSDRRRGTSNRESEGARGGYDSNIAAYFQQGYDDGYNNRSRQYDVPLGNTPPTYPPYPGQGNTTGTAYWNGRVDDRANIIIRGSTIYAENVSGNQTTTSSQNITGSLSRRATNLTVRKREGRGSVSIIQQPNRSNNFTAIIQIYDPKGGASNYKIEASWAGGANVEEPYQSGSVSWRGRVDQTANIVISGSDVQSLDVAATGLWSVSHNITGYLARRPGSVSASKRRGRGTVTVLQQPTWENDFTAIIQVFDPNGGADNYEVDISW
ncbi:MAG: hypothetical protein ACKVQW_15440 [Pyrinomonadaceae bacterium]